MTSVPYPSFTEAKLVGATNNRGSLSAVGRCRINLDLLAYDAYRTIVAKNVEQAHVVVDGENKDDQKKFKKKLMKEGVAMAKDLIIKELQLDVSIIEVETVVASADLISTDGCLAACLLDAGCQAIVTNGINLEAMNAARIPRERLIAHFEYDTIKGGPGDLASNLTASLTSVALLAYAVSIELTDGGDITVDTIVEIAQKAGTVEGLEVIIQIPTTIDEVALENMMKEISIQAPKIKISLIDPSARQLGLSYAACMKTDRQDNLYTTIVCTRNGEALGLVYSSKVCV